MPTINFPSSPVINQTYTEGQNKWVWTGSVWDLVCDPTPLPQTTFSGTAPIDVNVVTEPDGDKQVTVSHNNSGVSPGVYNKVTVDAKGHVTSGEFVDEQNNFVRVLRIPSDQINFTNDIKDEIAAYINQMNPPLVIDKTDSKWNVVIDGAPSGILDSATEINVWFDNSGSMGDALQPLVNMVSSCLKQLLLPIYESETVYNQRVKVRSFTNFTTAVNGKTVSFLGKANRGGQSAEERTLYMLDTMGSSTDITRVINLVFQDESNAAAPPPEVYHKIPFDGVRTSIYDADLALLRASLDAVKNSNYYYGVIYQLSQNTSSDNAFKAFLQAISNGTGNFSGTNGISDLVASGEISIQYDLLKNGTSSYYLNLIRNTMISLGFNNVGDTSSINCLLPITGQIVTSCTASLGNINVISVSGGTGTGYYFTLNGGETQYNLVSGATGLTNGTYSVRIYDSDGNNFLLGNAVTNCVTPLVGTATQSCLNNSGTNGKIDVTGVSGGSGSGYYFRLNGGVTQYIPGTGATGLSDGSYTVVLYDGAGTSINLGTLNISCIQTYNINRYLCGTCTTVGTGAVAYNPSQPLQVGKFYLLTNGQVAEVTGISNFPVSYVVSDVLSYWDSCSLVPCP